ncbi:MAG: hypothetical protein JRN62_03085 [Nitrososphaerota archaeon]|jgi:hypothetical protein|nr:hypothetical protein [Nitrososphaerota archaeon]
MLNSSGAAAIRIDLGYGPWFQGNQTEIGLMTSYIQGLRSYNRTLVIADVASETYSGAGNQPSWAQFQADWVQRVTRSRLCITRRTTTGSPTFELGADGEGQLRLPVLHAVLRLLLSSDVPVGARPGAPQRQTPVSYEFRSFAT